MTSPWAILHLTDAAGTVPCLIFGSPNPLTVATNLFYFFGSLDIHDSIFFSLARPRTPPTKSGPGGPESGLLGPGKTHSDRFAKGTSGRSRDAGRFFEGLCRPGSVGALCVWRPKLCSDLNLALSFMGFLSASFMVYIWYLRVAS